MDILKLVNVNKFYSQKNLNILKNINLTIDNGKFVTILDRSESGKTTLLNLIKSS